MAPGEFQTMETMEECGLDLDESGPLVPAEVLRSYSKRDKISNSSTSKMGYISVVCIVLNRMIGSGIFRTPTTVINGTQSIGATLLFWFAGACAAVAGTIVFVELGLTTPVYKIRGVQEPVPRNGGNLNYLQYLYHNPQRLAVCIFTVLFMVLGNMAGNSLFFGEYIMAAAGAGKPEDIDSDAMIAYNVKVRCIAIAAVTLACILHGLWRKGGIYLNNFFAMIKVLILLLIIVVGICAWAGVFKGKANHAATNMSLPNSFQGSENDSYGYCQAFLAVIFAYGGFDQANYILGEVRHPRKTFARSAIWSVTLVCILYMLVNIAYMVVVSKEDQLKTDADVALQFFANTIGEKRATQTVAAFMAISSLGNIIVMTFTAARVKQEIGKEGLLPPRSFSVFIGKNRRLRNAFRYLSNNNNQSQSLDAATPVGGLLIHWAFSIILILATWSRHPTQAYRILVNLYSYAINAFFGVALGVGVLSLRLRQNTGEHSWASSSPFGWWLSVPAALLYTIANAFPLVAMWIPPTDNENIPDQIQNLYPGYRSFVTPTIGCSLVAAGVVYWIGFTYLWPRVGDNHGKKLMVLKDVFVTEEEEGGFVQNHEIVGFEWEAPADEPKYVELESETRLPDGGVVTVHIWPV